MRYNDSPLIVHIDMDAFFAAVEQRDNPLYRGKPVVVGSDPEGGKGRGVVSTCSYEARAYGIHSAMPISQAYRRCPQAVFLPVDMDKYCAVSKEIHDIFYSFTPDIEPISIDEAFLDISTSYHLFGKTPEEVCMKIKKKIYEHTHLTASLGLAPTKMVAKIASDLKKPDGFVVVRPEEIQSFLSPLPVRKLWGVGKKSEDLLLKCGLKTIGDIAQKEMRDIEKMLGASGVDLWQLARGIDERKVEASEGAQSVSNEETFREDTNDVRLIENTILALSEKVSMRLRDDGYKGRTITLKLRYADFTTITRSKTLSISTNFVEVIYEESLELLRKARDRRKHVRLVGVKVSQLSTKDTDWTLFDEPMNEKKEKVHSAVDAIRHKFGDAVIYRGK